MILWRLSAQNNSYIILSSYVEGHVQKNSTLNFMSLVGFQASKIWTFFFGKFFMELFWKSFSGRNSSLEFPGVFLFSSSFPYDLLALRVLRDWLDGFWGNRHSEMQKSFCWQSFCVFQSPLWIYELLWNAKSCFF